MSDDRETKFGVLPYSDGSGYGYNIRITSPKDGTEGTVEIGRFSTEVYVSISEWATLRDAIDAGVKHHLALGLSLQGATS